MTCPGHRRFSNGRLLGICVSCDLQQDSEEDPPMCVTLEAGRYVCTQRQYTAPILLPVYQPRDSFADGVLKPRQASPVGAIFRGR